MNILCVIDAQNDFVSGVLGNEQAQKTVEKIVENIDFLKPDVIITTQDTHFKLSYKNTIEGKTIPLHCVYSSEGYDIVSEIRDTIAKQNTWHENVEKDSFGTERLVERIEFILDETMESLDTIILMGYCTDTCVISNALLLKTAFPNVPIAVIENCCAGSTPEAHEAAITIMKNCQIEII